jgi:APA family basic amino acid/polyamine antiporter
MSDAQPSSERHLGLVGATGVGIGAIVGGGILVLAGSALALTGPSAIVAFLLNGALAVITAVSFAEMATAFPESGGTYTFAKKLLSVRAAFAVGWIAWFAYIAAGVLYALGAATYGLLFVRSVLALVHVHPVAALSGRGAAIGVACLATGYYTWQQIRRASGGGQWETWGKVALFAVLIVTGAVVYFAQPPGVTMRTMRPFFAHGVSGLLGAAGMTFIALQGFDLIAAVGGEVKDPGRTIPRAMLGSLGAALCIYIPLLFIVVTVGAPKGTSIVALAHKQPDTLIAAAALQYLGPAGYWVVLVAAILSMLSALNANLLAASRVALTMARDRTLPGVIGRVHARFKTPMMAVYTSGLALVAIVLMIPDVASAGAAASLIFLICFAFAHAMAFLARRREALGASGFRAPWFPLFPVVGAIGCVGLAIYQGFAVPQSGVIALVWLGLGVLLYFGLFASRAQTVDALAEAYDPTLLRLRGRSPLVLVPIANPKSAHALNEIAHALAPPGYGRVLLLNVLPPLEAGGDDARATLRSLQEVLTPALHGALASGQAPEALLTIAPAPWDEIARIASEHACESVLLGYAHSADADAPSPDLEQLLNRLTTDVAFLRAPEGWRPADAQRVVVPIGGRGGQHELRARLLGSLARDARRKVVYLSVVRPDASPREVSLAEQIVKRLASDETRGLATWELVRGTDLGEVMSEQVGKNDLMVLGLQQLPGGRKVFGNATQKILKATSAPAILISRGR